MLAPVLLLGVVLAAVATVVAVTYGSAGVPGDEARNRPEAAGARMDPLPAEPPPPLEPMAPPFEQPRYRDSRAVGLPYAGRLERGVQFPAGGPSFFTWDPIFRTTPDRGWRRYATDDTVRTILRVLEEFRAAHPDAPRVGVGDLSRPRGGDFGPRFGSIGHASHQNGLDADVYYPRHDRREAAPRTPAQVDQVLSQDLVDRFVRAGAERVFVGPSLTLTGPGRVVSKLPHHDNHLHVRFAKPRNRKPIRDA